jgi:hypothetical protein
MLRVHFNAVVERQEEEGEPSTNLERRNTKKSGVLQTFVLGADVIGARFVLGATAIGRSFYK